MKTDKERGRVFSTRLSESWGFVDLKSLFLKTWQTSLLIPGGWESFLGSLPKSGMCVNGKLYQQPMLMRNTCGNGGGVWPTPTTQEIEHENIELTETNRRKTKDGKNSHSLNLADKVKWPTPSKSDGYNANMKNNHDIKKGHLRGLVIKWPTSRAREGNCGPFGSKSFYHNLENCEKDEGQLNSEFVEWLMGYPIFFTNIDKPTGKQYDISIEPDIPRLTTIKKNRANRLKCLGNAVVPQCVALIGKYIKESGLLNEFIE